MRRSEMCIRFTCDDSAFVKAMSEAKAKMDEFIAHMEWVLKHDDWGTGCD